MVYTITFGVHFSSLLPTLPLSTIYSIYQICYIFFMKRSFREPTGPKGVELEPSLLQTVRALESKLFPEFLKNDHGHTQAGKGDFYFTPSHHFRRGLITADTIQRLRAGGELLSFGAGRAYLEELLVRGFQIDAGHITLVDKNTDDFPDGFVELQIDMHGAWPDFGKKFDIIIFPESFTSFLAFIEQRGGFNVDSGLVRALVTLLQRCAEILKENGEIRGDGHNFRLDELQIARDTLAQSGISLEWDKHLLVAKKMN